jgi:hypothetical protein
MKRLLFIPLLLAAAACERRDPVAEEANDVAGLPAPADATTTDPSGAPPPPNSSSPPSPGSGPSQTVATIPAALHGRWGLTPADCTSTRGDAKGLLIVSAADLKFYESRAVPSGNTQSSSDSFSADFTFTGEGMTWTKFETLQMKGKELVRTESSPMASFTYAKCA